MRRDAVDGLQLTGRLIGLYFACVLAVSCCITPRDLETGRVRLVPPQLLLGGTRHHCPFCGLTRSFCALSHGDLTAGRRYHPAGPVFYAFFVLTALWTLSSLTMAVCRRSANNRYATDVEGVT